MFSFAVWVAKYIIVCLVESVSCVVAALLEAGYAWGMWLFFYFLG